MLPVDSERDEKADTILVVEDEILIRLVVAEYLRDCGYRVIEAINADEAVTVLQQGEQDIDIVFTDIEMPGTMDGFGLAQWVRVNHPDCQVILAGSVARAASEAAHLCNDNGSIAKPYDGQTVVNRIRRLLASRKPGRLGPIVRRLGPDQQLDAPR